MTERPAHPTRILFLDAIARADCPKSETTIGQMAGCHLGIAFADIACRYGDRPALTTPSHTWSYQDLISAAWLVTAWLKSSDAWKAGNRVVVMLPNCHEYLAALYGTLLAGGVVVPVPPKTEKHQFHSILNSTSPFCVVTQPRIARNWMDSCLHPQIEHLGLDDLSGGKDSLAIGPSFPQPDVTGSTDQPGDSLAAIFFTGGSSGTPKGVMLSHRNLIENARSIRQYLQIDPSDRPLCVLPFYHAFGNSILQSHLLTGSHLVVDGNTSFPQTLIDAIHRHRVTSLSGVPDLFRFLLERSSLDSLQESSLRYMAVAGGALPFTLATRMSEGIKPAQFFVMYGQTEATARLAYVPPERLIDLQEGCIGRPVPGVELQVVDEQGRPVAPGAIGEIRARGPNIMLGYWQDPNLSRETLRDGWLMTGDLGTVDAEGWIYHRGCHKSIIKVAGYRFHASDVEQFVVRELPIQQAVVVPYEIPGQGTRLALYARPDPVLGRPTAAEIVGRCRSQLPRHMVPDLIRLVDEFPLNNALKIDRPRLAVMAAESVLRRQPAA